MLSRPIGGPPRRSIVDGPAVIKAGYLTPWQAQQVAGGRGEELPDRQVYAVGPDRPGGDGAGLPGQGHPPEPPGGLEGPLAGAPRTTRRRSSGSAARRRLGAQLQHENLVRVYDEGEVNGQCYLVMEYIEGSSVGQLLAGHGPMPTSTAARLARQVALGLEHARRKGMIHRDVNPHNLLVTLDGTAKLTDMGLAIELGDDDAMTLDGGLVGNYDYISPEQVRHSRDGRLPERHLLPGLYPLPHGGRAGPVPLPQPAGEDPRPAPADPPR